MPFPKWMRKVYGNRTGWRCEICNRRYASGWMIEFHHIYPTSAGGEDTFENMQALCLEHHYLAHLALRRKGVDHPASAGIVKSRWKRTGGRTKWWLRKHGRR